MARSFSSFFAAGSGEGLQASLALVSPGPLPVKSKGILNNTNPNSVFVLPGTPQDLDWFEWVAGPISFSANPVKFRSTAKIMGQIGDIAVNTDGECGLFVYFASIQSWVLYSTGVGAGGSLVGPGGTGGSVSPEAITAAIAQFTQFKLFDGGPVAGKTRILPNNTQPLVAQLPNAPVDGEWVEWTASHIPFSQHSLTFNSDRAIAGLGEPLVIDVDGACGLLIYSQAANSWLVYYTGTGTGGTANGTAGVAGGSPKVVGTQLKAGDYFVPNNSQGPAIHDAPLNPADLAVVEWVEGAVSFGVNKLVIRNTDKPIMGLNEPLEVEEAGSGGKMIYYATLGYWKVYLTNQAGDISNPVRGAHAYPDITTNITLSRVASFSEAMVLTNSGNVVVTLNSTFMDGDRVVLDKPLAANRLMVMSSTPIIVPDNTTDADPFLEGVSGQIKLIRRSGSWYLQI